MPRRAAKGGPVAKRRDDDEDGSGRSEEAVTLPRAGDTARQIGMGFLKMADVVDECPPLAKLFEGGLERFQEVFQAPGALLAVSGSGAGVSHAEDPAKSPSGSKRKLVGGAAGAEGGSGGGGAGGRGGATGAGGSSPTLKGAAWSEDGARGRRGTRGSRVDTEAEAWPGLEQALRASKKDMAASAAGRGASKGLGVRSRPAIQKAKDESAKRDRKPSPPVPAALGFPPAPPPRRAAAQALHRMSALSSSGISASPVAAADPSRKPAHVEPKTSAAAGADGAEGSASAGGKKTNGKKGPAKEDGGGAKKPEASKSVTAAKKSRKGGPAGAKAASAPVSKAGGADEGGVSQIAGGSGKVKGGGAAPSDLPGGPDKRPKTGDDLLRRLDARVFRFVEAGGCRLEGCEVRDKAHCHRGPGCDCTRNSGTYMWPSELQKMVRHQERHREWNTKPAFGKRVLLEFEGGTYYPGTINTYGDSAKDISHSKGKWGVLFDDCTRDRFADGAADVMISNQPRPTKVSKELHDYYRRHENGRKLLEGVKIFPETKKAEAAGANGQNKKQSPAGKKGGSSEKRKRHKSSDNKPRRESNPDEIGGASNKLKHATAEETLNETVPEASSARGVGASGASGAKNKRKHSVATEDEETDIEMEEPETGASSLKQEDKSGGAARRDDGGGGGCASESGSVKGHSRGKKKGASDSGSGDGGGANNVSRKMSSKVLKQEGEEGGDVGVEGGNEENGEHSGVTGREGVRGGAAKLKKSKKAHRKQQQSSDGLSSGGDGDGGDGRTSAYAHRYGRGPGAVVLSAPDSPGLGATVVGEGGGGVGEKGKDEHDGVEPDWVSPTSHEGAASPSPNARRKQSPLPPPSRQLSPAQQQQQRQQQHQPKRMTVSEEEESTEEEEEAVRAVDGRLGQAATYDPGATNTASPMSRSSGAAGRGGSGEANVVPMLHPPSSAATPDSTTLSVAHVLVSQLRMVE